MRGGPAADRGTPIAAVASVVRDAVPALPHAGRLGRVISGLLLKTPSLRMRLDRALPIMQAVADDPSAPNSPRHRNPSSRPGHPDRLHA